MPKHSNNKKKKKKKKKKKPRVRVELRADGDLYRSEKQGWSAGDIW